MKEYSTIKPDIVSNTIVIDKSQFIGYACGVDSVEQAIQFVADISKKHHDATHNCYAYIVGDRAKFSDNGEPQGTAGLPMYECIKANKLDKVAVVVTRYFGGIKLGAGGLVRAYSGSTADVLNCCTRLHYQQCSNIDIIIDYSLIKIVKKTMEGSGILCDTVYDANVILKYLVLTDTVSSISNRIVDITCGRAVVETTSNLLCPYGE